MRFHQLYPLPDSPPHHGGINVDIVLVHGLGGHYTDTWKAKDETVWAKDLLPEGLPSTSIRVLSFQYGGSIKGTASKAGLDDTAQSLLQHLRDRREDAGLKWRPIIFVGHSLGGVIIKRAIRIAYNNTQFKSIKNTTLGVVFFATPHHGSPEQFMPALVRLLECNGPRLAKLPSEKVRPTKNMINEIKQNPQLFAFISGDFIYLTARLRFKTFREKDITAPLQVPVVGPHEGSMGVDTEDVVMISGDHLSLCKFGQNQKASFKLVSKKIEEMIEQSPRQKGLRQRQNAALDWLCSDALCQSMMTKKLMDGTGKWVFERPQFKDWLDQESGQPRLWISGKPGCGKSYLAKHIVDELRDQGKSVVCTFLSEPDPIDADAWHLLSEILQHALDMESGFHLRQSSSGTGVREHLLVAHKLAAHKSQPTQESPPTENNVQGLLASSVRQVLDMAPELIDKLLTRDWKDDKPPNAWTLDNLKKLWVEAFTESLEENPAGSRIGSLAEHSLIVVIDGFDIIKRQCQMDFLEILEGFKKTSRTYRNLRLLLFSNEYPEMSTDIEKSGFAQYAIQVEDTETDITPAIHRRLEAVNRIYRYPPKFQEEIGDAVPKAANGVYLRADLMLGGLKRTRYDQGNLSELLGSPSNGIEKLYDHLFGRIWTRGENGRSIRQVLLWVVFQRERLSPDELSIALALGKARENLGAVSLRDVDRLKSFIDERIALWVGRFCGHIIKLEDERFEIVHPTLKKYLTTKPSQLEVEYGDDVDLPYHAETYMDAAEGHARLGNLCASYLAMTSFETPLLTQTKSWDAWQAAVQARMKEHKFLRYAALHWSEHLKLARDLAAPGNAFRGGKVDRQRQQLLEDELEGHAQSWAEVVCYFHDWHEHDWHKNDRSKICPFDGKIKHKIPPSMDAAVRRPSVPETIQPDPQNTGPRSPERGQPDPETIKPSSESPWPALETRQPTTVTRQSGLEQTQFSTPERRQPNIEGMESMPTNTRPSTPKTTQPKRLVQSTSNSQRWAYMSSRPVTPLSSQDNGRPHWLVRGAQKVVDKLHLEENKKS